VSKAYKEMKVEKWVGIEEVMEHLGLSRWTILTWIKEGKLPAYMVGKRYKFKLSEVEEYIRTEITK
jgi:excisionase family DNA binding protein